MHIIIKKIIIAHFFCLVVQANSWGRQSQSSCQPAFEGDPSCTANALAPEPQKSGPEATAEDVSPNGQEGQTTLDPAKEGDSSETILEKSISEFHSQNKSFSLLLIEKAIQFLQKDALSPAQVHHVVKMLSAAQGLSLDQMLWEALVDGTRSTSSKGQALARQVYRARRQAYQAIQSEEEAPSQAQERFLDWALGSLDAYFDQEAALRSQVHLRKQDPEDREIDAAIEAFDDQNEKFSVFLLEESAKLLSSAQLDLRVRIRIRRMIDVAEGLALDKMHWKQFVYQPSTKDPKERRFFQQNRPQALKNYKAREKAYEVIRGFEKRDWQRMDQALTAAEAYFKV